MKRLLLVLALAGFAVACGDDDDDDTSPDGGGGGKVDSGAKPDGGGSIDSGTPSTADAGPKTNAVTNVGAACTSNSECMGSAATCKTATALGSPYPGGICSFTCKYDVECGTGGACPLGEAALDGQPVTGAQTVTTQDCYKTCSASADCRTGYICATMRQVFQSNAQLTMLFPNLPANDNLDKKVCVPAPAGDAGTPDAGRTSDAGGVDAAR